MRVQERLAGQPPLQLNRPDARPPRRTAGNARNVMQQDHHANYAGAAGKGLKSQTDWSSRSEIKTKVSGLPSDVTTLEVSDIFASEGTITRIELLHHPDGTGKGMAFVVFSPPPVRAFWAGNTYEARIQDRNENVKLRIMLLDLPEATFYTGLHTGKRYPENMTLTVESLDFGILYDEKTMMILYNTKAFSDMPISIRQSLRYREIEVCFPIQFRGNPNTGGTDRLE